MKRKGNSFLIIIQTPIEYNENEILGYFGWKPYIRIRFQC